MRIGFFGGSFDPPHRGHLAIAQAAADHCALDRVLFAPTARQPLKPNGAEASFADRLAMTQLLCVADSRMEASALDGPQPEGAPNYTIDALHRLRQALPQKTPVTVIVGIDAFLDLRQWRSPDELLQGFEWAVISRPGFSSGSIDALDLTSQQREHVRLIEGIAETASATAVRDALAHGRDAGDLLSPAVFGYIREHGLYGYGQ